MILTNGHFPGTLKRYAAEMVASGNRLLDAMSKEVRMAKVITARDVVVVRVITAFAPSVADAGLTIRYDYLLDDPDREDQEWIAYVKVPGNQLVLKLLEEREGSRSRWVPIWLGVSGGPGPRIGRDPGSYTVGENRKGYVFTPRR